MIAQAKIAPAVIWRTFIRLLNDCKGVAAIEFAILSLPFFMLVFAILEISLIFVGEFLVDRATQAHGRYIRTGQVQQRSLSKTEFQRMFCKSLYDLIDCRKLQIDLKSHESFRDMPTTTPIQNGELQSSNFTFEAVEPGEIAYLRVFYEWPVVTEFMRKSFSNLSNGNHLISGNYIFKAEQYE